MSRSLGYGPVRIAWHPDEHADGHAPRYERQLRRAVRAVNTRRYPDLVRLVGDPNEADVLWRVQTAAQMGKHLTAGGLMEPTLGKVISDPGKLPEVWVVDDAVAQASGGLRILTHEIFHCLGLPHPKWAQDAWAMYGIAWRKAPKLEGGIMESDPEELVTITRADRVYAHAVLFAGHRPGGGTWRRVMRLGEAA